MELEEKLGKVAKPTTEIYRKQISDLNTKLTSETDRADKCKFENDRLMEKLEALTVEKDRIVAERDQLKESNEEMKYNSTVGNTSPEFSQISDEPDSGLLENIPPSVKARLIRLEKENQQLKKYKTSSSNDDNDASELQAMMQDLMKDKEEISKR